MSLKLIIVSPERVEFNGEVESVTVPGIMGEFQVLQDHAPLISSLENGRMVYKDASGRHELSIAGGFIEVQKNTVSVCVELP